MKCAICERAQATLLYVRQGVGSVPACAECGATVDEALAALRSPETAPDLAAQVLAALRSPETAPDLAAQVKASTCAEIGERVALGATTPREGVREMIRHYLGRDLEASEREWWRAVSPLMHHWSGVFLAAMDAECAETAPDAPN